MKHLVSFRSLLAALCLGLPTTGLSNDHHDRSDWHGHYYGPYSHYRPYYPYYYPYYGYGFYGPSIGVTIGSDPAPTYRGARVDDHGDELAVDVQRALRHGGYYHGDIDGDVGSGTRAAIRQYQYDHRLEVTGRIDRALLGSLGLD